MLLEIEDYYWEGSEEECCDCHDKYPMTWMVMCDSGLIRCFDCYHKNLIQEQEYERKIKNI